MQRQHRGGALPQLDLGNQAHREAGPVGDLLERQPHLVAPAAAPFADHGVQSLLDVHQEPVLADRIAQDGPELTDLERLLQIVEGAVLHGGNRRLDARLPGHADHAEIVVQRADLLEQRDAVPLRIAQVEQHHVVLPILDGARRHRGILQLRGPEALLEQEGAEGISGLDVRVHDENTERLRARHDSHLASGGGV